MKKKRQIKVKIIVVSVIALLIVLSTIFADILAPNDPFTTSATSIRLAPCKEYPFGTDNLGRCVFSRILYGGRTTIAATFILVLISFVVGVVIGMISGYYGGLLDKLLMRLADIVLAFPQMVVAIVVAGILGGGLFGAMIALGITMWVSFARLSRSHTFSIKNQEFIQAALFSGKSDLYIIAVHIFPNILPPFFIIICNIISIFI